MPTPRPWSTASRPPASARPTSPTSWADRKGAGLGLDSLALQLLGGLSHATTLFLMACGLTLIFGVTRIVNFAHGSFFMLGALVSAHALTRWWPELGESALGYAAAMLLAFGPDEVFAPRFPGLKGALMLGEAYLPTWQLFTLALGPLVWWALHLLLTRTLWGKQVKAATQDRDMLGA